MTIDVKKLQDDPIVEALLDVRFQTENLPEVITGRLADLPLWKLWPKAQTAAAQIPAVIRSTDESLRFQAVIEAKSPDGTAVGRIGSNSLALSFLKRYPGWGAAAPKLADMVNGLFSTLGKVEVTRLGLRYINVLTSKRHLLNSVADLALTFRVGDQDLLEGPFNVNYLTTHSESHISMTRVASVHLVKPSNQMPSDAAAVIDIDVFTPSAFKCVAAADALSWLESAHAFEKTSFFTLFRPAHLSKLKVA